MAGIQWSKEMEELKDALRTMPQTFATEGDHRAEEAAAGAAVAVRQAYARHWVTGALAKRVTVGRYRKGRARGWIVKSTAPHAWMFEHGTQTRQYVTKAGATHLTGAMPAHPTFEPTMPRYRKPMYRALIDMLKRAGLLVTGDA